MNKILVIGGGGREHAMCRALATGRDAPAVFIAPGNPGTTDFAENVAVDVADCDAVVALARRLGVDLVIPGPEQPLVDGLADALQNAGIPCCGPSKAAARLEGSKQFTREIAAKAGVPSPQFAIATDVAGLTRAVEAFPGVPVVKADGLAAGKGVFLPDSKPEAVETGTSLLDGRLGAAGATVVLEERLLGTEASLFYACHGTDAVALPHARDHKRLLDADQGPNTGGMGAISPNPLISASLEQQVTETLIKPVLETMVAAGTPFVGFLFAGVMLTEDGPKLLEFNVRLGDPEAQCILPRLAPGMLASLCRATATGTLAGVHVDVLDNAVCNIVLSADGYPDSPRKGDVIDVHADFPTQDRWLIHAGTAERDGRLVTAGGRVAAIVAQAPSAHKARALAYEGVQWVQFDGKHWRTDIGA